MLPSDLFLLYFLADAVGDAPDFTAEPLAVGVDTEIAAVGDGEKFAAVAVRVGDVLKKPLSVEQLVPDRLIVRDDLLFRETETGEIAPERRVRALAGELRLGVNRSCCRH